jgi:alpha-galactosidase
MFSRIVKRQCACIVWLAGVQAITISPARAQAPPDPRQSMDTAQRWVAAKFLGEPDRAPKPSYLLPDFASETLGRDGIEGRQLRIADRKFTRGLYFPSDGKVHVVLNGPAKSFEAVVGVDSNDLGYYSNVGRGAAVASVEVGGKALIKTRPMREGMASVPIKVDLIGASEFDIKVEDGGGGTVLRVNFDRVDWADARVVMVDGTVVALGNLPLGPLPGSISSDAPFSFRYGEQASSAFLKSWDLQRATRQLDENRTEHTLTYTDPKTGLEVRAVAIAYRDFPVVEWTLYFKNAGSEPTPILEGIQALDLGLERAANGEFVLHHNKGAQTTPTDFEPYTDQLEPGTEKRITPNGGRPTNTNLCYFNVAAPGEGTIIGIGWPGSWAASFTRDTGAGLRVQIGQELTHFKLLPGEEVRTPLVALLFWKGDWIDGQNVWREWMVAHNIPRPGGKLPAPLLSSGSNSYAIEMQGATEENQKEYMQDYWKLGWKFDYWWMDAGWYPWGWGWSNTGTWEPDPKRFPRGLKPISDFAHQNNVKTLVWFEPERVTHDTWISDNHPEWLLGPKDGRDRLLDLGNPQALAWLIDHIDKVLTEQGIDLYRQDMNFDPIDYWRANDASDRQGITEIRHVEGYLAYWDALRKRHPGMLIDTCAGGGRRLDLESLRRAVPLWRSDYAFDQPAPMQDLAYGLAQWLPFFGTAARSSNPYSFRSAAMGLAVTMQADPRSTSVDFPALIRLTDQWRQFAPDFYGDYYPLTPYSTEESAWMAWQFNRGMDGEGLVEVFRRADSPMEKASFKLRGLDASADYVVMNLDAEGARRYTGRELMEDGLQVEILKAREAVVLRYRRVAMAQ